MKAILELHPVHVRHNEIGKHQVGPDGPHLAQGVLGAGEQQDLITESLQKPLQEQQDMLVVIDDEDDGFGAHGWQWWLLFHFQDLACKDAKNVIRIPDTPANTTFF